LAIEIIPERAHDGLAVSGGGERSRHQVSVKG
jgi:hypothetical protein